MTPTKPNPSTESAPASLAPAPGSAWVNSEWLVWMPFVFSETEPYTQWAGPFPSKEHAEVWIRKQNGWPTGLRAGKSAILWNEPPNEKAEP